MKIILTLLEVFVGYHTVLATFAPGANPRWRIFNADGITLWRPKWHLWSMQPKSCKSRNSTLDVIQTAPLRLMWSKEEGHVIRMPIRPVTPEDVILAEQEEQQTSSYSYTTKRTRSPPIPCGNVSMAPCPDEMVRVCSDSDDLSFSRRSLSDQCVLSSSQALGDFVIEEYPERAEQIGAAPLLESKSRCSSMDAVSTAAGSVAGIASVNSGISSPSGVSSPNRERSLSRHRERSLSSRQISEGTTAVQGGRQASGGGGGTSSRSLDIDNRASCSFSRSFPMMAEQEDDINWGKSAHKWVTVLQFDEGLKQWKLFPDSQFSLYNDDWSIEILNPDPQIPDPRWHGEPTPESGTVLERIESPVVHYVRMPIESSWMHQSSAHRLDVLHLRFLPKVFAVGEGNHYVVDRATEWREGPLGRVYLGVNHRGNERVAMKVVDKSLLLPHDIERLKTNLEIVHKRLTNSVDESLVPALAGPRDIIDTEDHLFIISEYAKGGDLERYVQDKKFTESEAAQIFWRVLQAVEKLHEQGIVHGVLHMGNILLPEVPRAGQDFPKKVQIADLAESRLSVRLRCRKAIHALWERRRQINHENKVEQPESKTSSSLTDRLKDAFALGGAGARTPSSSPTSCITSRTNEQMISTAAKSRNYSPTRGGGMEEFETVCVDKPKIMIRQQQNKEDEQQVVLVGEDLSSAPDVDSANVTPSSSEEPSVQNNSDAQPRQSSATQNHSPYFFSNEQKPDALRELLWYAAPEVLAQLLISEMPVTFQTVLRHQHGSSSSSSSSSTNTVEEQVVKEQAANHVGAATPRFHVSPGADAWSLGVLLYTLVCGKRPWTTAARADDSPREVPDEGIAFQSLLSGYDAIPEDVSVPTRHLIQRLLAPAHQRISVADVKSHTFLKVYKPWLTGNIADYPTRNSEDGKGMSGFVERRVFNGEDENYISEIEKKRTQSTVAVKVFNQSIAPERVHKEVEAMRLLDPGHPNIVRLYKAIFDKESSLFGGEYVYPYLVMEYINGGELFEVIYKRQQFACRNVYRETQFWGSDILHALLYMHDRSVVHRDVKPENLLVQDPRKNNHNHARPYLKLVDFGFSKRHTPGVEEPLKTACGSSQYVAPEVIVDRSYDKECDWWSFGAVLYVMLSGAGPFDGGTESKTFRNIKKCNWNFQHLAKLMGRIPFDNQQDPGTVMELLTAVFRRVRNGRGMPLLCGGGEAIRLTGEEIAEHEFFTDLHDLPNRGRPVGCY